MKLNTNKMFSNIYDDTEYGYFYDPDDVDYYKRPYTISNNYVHSIIHKNYYDNYLSFDIIDQNNIKNENFHIFISLLYIVTSMILIYNLLFIEI
jgi:hypothetical protein